MTRIQEWPIEKQCLRRQRVRGTEERMLWAWFGILLVLWLAGWLTNVAGPWIHVLLAAAVVVLVLIYLETPPPACDDEEGE